MKKRIIVLAVAVIVAIFTSFATGCSSDGNTGSSAFSPPEVFFPGAGTTEAGSALMPDVGPETSDECGTGTPNSFGASQVIEESVDCFYEEGQTVPAAAIEQILEVIDDITLIHIRLTLDPQFVDNSYGENAIGWEDSKKGTHTFDEIVGSDHAEMKLYDKNGKLILHFKMDYLSESKGDQQSGEFGTLGVTGGDGKMIEGDESAIIGVATSMDRNLNGCGFDEYTENSPITDEQYTPDPQAGEWDYRVVYELWVDAEPFGDVGFGEAIIEHVHASPSKVASNTIIVIPDECPECDPEVEDCDPWVITPI